MQIRFHGGGEFSSLIWLLTYICWRVQARIRSPGGYLPQPEDYELFWYIHAIAPYRC